MKPKRKMTEQELAEYRAYREARKFAREQSLKYVKELNGPKEYRSRR